MRRQCLRRCTVLTCKVRVLSTTVIAYRHIKRRSTPGDSPTNTTQAENAEPATADFVCPTVALTSPITAFDKALCTDNLAGARQHQPKGQIGNVVGEYTRRIANLNITLVGGLSIYTFIPYTKTAINCRLG